MTSGTWVGRTFFAICDHCRLPSIVKGAETVHKKLVMTSRMNEISRVCDTIHQDVVSHGFSDNALWAIRLAVNEAIKNAIEHGNRKDPRKYVTVKYSVSEDSVEIVICDEGCGFNPETVPDPLLDENLERCYGRGIILMRWYMSDVRFNRQANCVTLLKRREARSSALTQRFS